MRSLLLRAYQLLASNPRLFYRRLGLLVRRPAQSVRLVRETQRRNAAVDRAYRVGLLVRGGCPRRLCRRMGRGRYSA